MNAGLYNALERLYHEPHRLAIMSALSTGSKGWTFNELKESCGLTDGNLSRHLKALETAKAVRIKKSFVGARPRTTVFITAKGQKEFVEYLRALEKVLHEACAGLETSEGDMPVGAVLAKA